MEVLSLLRSKNRCLERFLNLSKDFLAGIDQNALSGLTEFEAKREATLKAIELFDRKIGENVTYLQPSDRTPDFIFQVRNNLKSREKLVHEILALDLEIIGRIEKIKNELLKEMNAVQKSKTNLSRFKSSWVPESGETLDETR